MRDLTNKQNIKQLKIISRILKGVSFCFSGDVVEKIYGSDRNTGKKIIILFENNYDFKRFSKFFETFGSVCCYYFDAHDFVKYSCTSYFDDYNCTPLYSFRERENIPYYFSQCSFDQTVTNNKLFKKITTKYKGFNILSIKETLMTCDRSIALNIIKNKKLSKNLFRFEEKQKQERYNDLWGHAFLTEEQIKKNIEDLISD
jgi:hypothetical protein